MPTPGLSLVGFMERDAAINYLKLNCIDRGKTDAELEAEWVAAKAKLGAPIARAGHPQVEQIPAGHESYLGDVRTFIASAAPTLNLDLAMVEIDQLLAFQQHIDTDRSNHHCSANAAPPLAESLNICLPITPPRDHYTIQSTPQSLIIRSRSLNLAGISAGMLSSYHAGIHFGWNLPLVHVVRLNGRCYLHNGFHRAYALRAAGATHIPCVIRDVPDAGAVGIRPDGVTFALPLLESANPPCVGHYTGGRAHPVELRITSRVFHVSWSEYVLMEE